MDTRVEFVKSALVEKTAFVFAKILGVMILAVFAIFFIGLSTIDLFIVIVLWIWKLWAGFLVVSSIYLIIAIVLWVQRKELIYLPIMSSFSNNS